MNWKVIRIIDMYIGIPLLYALAAFQKAFFRQIHERPPRTVRRMLLVKFWGIGNIFMMLPSVAALRRTYPAAQIDLLTLESSRQAAEYIKAFDTIHAVSTRGIPAFIWTTLMMVAALRRSVYDIVIDFEQFARFSAICIAAAGAGRSIGFQTAGQHRHLLFTHPVPYDNTVHVTRSYCSLASAAGTGPVTCDTSRLSFPSLEERKSGASNIRMRLGIMEDAYAVFHVGTSGNFRERRWPAKEYAALADRLVEETGMHIVLTGLAEEGFIADEIIGLSRRRDRLRNACGKASFQEYFELIRSCSIVVSADTAAVHIASAVGMPVVGLYGPNTPQLYGPWGVSGAAVYRQLPCSPCITNFNAKTHTCRHPEGKGACMNKITAREVSAEIRRHFPALSPGAPEKKPQGACGQEGKGNE